MFICLPKSLSYYKAGANIYNLRFNNGIVVVRLARIFAAAVGSNISRLAMRALKFTCASGVLTSINNVNTRIFPKQLFALQLHQSIR